MKYPLLLILLLLLPYGTAFSAEPAKNPKEDKVLSEVAVVLSNLKSMLAAKNYSAALKDAKELLKKTEYILNPAHPVLDDVYNILSTLYYYKNDYENAAYYMEKALAVEKAIMIEPEKMGKTIDLLAVIYSKLGKEDKVRELKILKAVIFRPMFAQPLAEKTEPLKSATVEIEEKKMPAPAAAAVEPEPSPEMEIEARLLSESEAAEVSNIPVAENMNASAKKVLWFYATFMLLLIAFGLLRKRRESLKKEENAALPEIKKQSPVSFSIASPEIAAEVKEVEAEIKTEVQEEPAAETPVPAEEAVPSADERWKEYQQRFSERQARIVLGIEEEASWDEIQNRYRDLMKTYDTKNLDYFSSELQKTAEFRREKIVQAFGILKRKQNFSKKTQAEISKPEFAAV